jgi:hypothetical protein
VSGVRDTGTAIDNGAKIVHTAPKTEESENKEKWMNRRTRRGEQTDRPVTGFRRQAGAPVWMPIRTRIPFQIKVSVEEERKQERRQKRRHE